MMRIVLLGAPGSGKGTIGDLLKHDFGYLKISTGDMIREEIKKNTDLGRRMKTFMEQGNLVPDEMIIEMVQNRLQSENNLKGYILDGFPRTLAQAESLSRLPASRGMAIFLDVDEEELVRRLLSRRTCSQCGAIYNLNNRRPQIEGICDICVGKIIQRTDDTEETIRQRICIYHQQTMPVIEYFRKNGRLVTIKGHGKPEQVYRRVKKGVA